MAIVTVKNKYQVVIPQSARDEIGIHVGDLLEVKAGRGKIVFTPKSLVDRGIAKSLEDFKQAARMAPSTHMTSF
jgi:AbrB family looped-hinge helix DNA binding protein